MNKNLGYALILAGIICVVSSVFVHFNGKEESASQTQPSALSQNVEATSTQVVADTIATKKPELTNAEKGKLFEDYIVSKFDFSRKALELVSRDDSRNAKQNADLLIKLTTKKGSYHFAVECTWRKDMPKGDFEWTKEETITKMLSSAKGKAAPLFLVLGIGGKPNSPGDIYIIPITKSKQATLESLSSYRCENMYGKFFYDAPSKKLTIK